MATYQENDICMKTLVSKQEKELAYELRYKVFTEELGWAPHNHESREVDGYDDNSMMVGLFLKGKLVACLRIIFPTERFMMEKEFLVTIGDHEIVKTPETIEVTRFCIDSEVRKDVLSTKYGEFPMVMALEKAFYSWCRNNNKDIVYMVVSKFFFRLLNLLGMPCSALAPAVTMADGVVAIAAISSWSAFEELNATKNTPLLRWFQDQSQMDITQLAAQLIAFYGIKPY